MSTLTPDDIAALEALLAKVRTTACEATASGANASTMRAEGAMRRLEIAAVNALPDLLALTRRGLAADARPDPAPEGTNPLDTPEVRRVIADGVRYFDCECDHPDKVVPGIVAALAPFVAAAQAAAWRAGVEAAAAECERIGAYQAERQRMEFLSPRIEEVAEAIRNLPPPAAFAAPESDALEALRPFAEIGQWLFARDLPDDTPLVEAGGINGYAVMLTRGHFKAAHRALREAEASAAEVPHG